MLAARQFAIILWKDVLIDLRRKENLVAMLLFSLLILMLFNFSFGGRDDVRYRLTRHAVQRLAEQGLPAEAAKALRALGDRTFPQRRAFLDALSQVGDAVPPAWRPRILAAAERTFVQAIAPGLLWVTFLLAGVLGLDKSFNQEKENAALEGLLLAPLPRGILYLGKLGGNVLFLAVLLALLLPVYALLFNVALWDVAAPLAAVMLGGVLGFAALGTLLGGITSRLRGKEVLLPLLLFPLTAPVLIVVVRLTDVLLTTGALTGQQGWINLLAAFDVVFLTVSYLVFDYIMEA